METHPWSFIPRRAERGREKEEKEKGKRQKKKEEKNKKKMKADRDKAARTGIEFRAVAFRGLI